MKQISLLFLETSVFFFSSVNIFTGNGNNSQPYTRKRIENSNNTTVNKEIYRNPKIKKQYNNTYNNNYYPNQNITISKINNRPEIKKRYNNNNNTAQNIFSTNNEIYNKKIPSRKDNAFNYDKSIFASNNNNSNQIPYINPLKKNNYNYRKQNMIPSNYEIYNKTQIPNNNNNNNNNTTQNISTSNQFYDEMNYNNNNINCNTINNTEETQHGYNINQNKNQGYSTNNFGMIPGKEFSNRQQYIRNKQLHLSELEKEPPINMQRYNSKLEEETINEIQRYHLELKEKTSDTKKDILINHGVVDPKKQIPGIRSSAYVTGYNNGRNNGRGCCGIKMKIEKNTVDMAKAKKNINNEIEKTIIEKFKNITFNIVLDNNEIKEIRESVFGNIDKIIIDNKEEVKEEEEEKEEEKEGKRKKKKSKKKLKEEQEKEIKRKIIAAKISIVQSCIEEIKNDDGTYFSNNDENNNAISLFEKFKNLLNTELKNLQIYGNKGKEILDNGDNEVKKIFEKHFGKKIENIITDDDFIRKEYGKFNESEINEGLRELDELKKENYDEYKERLNEFFKCIKTKTLANINEKKTKEFAANMKNELVGNIIEKVSEKVSIEKVKEKGIEIINKNTSKEDDNKNKNKNDGYIELKELDTKKN